MCRFFAWCTGFCIAATVLAQAEPEKPARTNVLLIAIDDLNDWVGCLGGHPQVRTPHIDTLAKRGTLFENAHCQAPLCNPSRTSVLLGRRPSATGVYGLRPWFRDVPALKDLVTLPKHFAAHEYRTLATGKVFHSHFGLRAGDDEFDIVGPQYADGPLPKARLAPVDGLRKTASRKNDWGPFPERDDQKGDYKIVSWAIEQLAARRSKKQPFFLSVGIRLPHLPLFAPPKWFALYPEDSIRLPSAPRTDRNDTPRFSWYLNWDLPEHRLEEMEHVDQWSNFVRSYLACVSFLDGQVGRLLNALEENGLADNTIVVLWSDHGYHLGEKLITGKNTLWEESTRVPLIFAGPGIGAASCDQPVELLDIYPTLCELCDLPLPPALEGATLRPQLRNPESRRERPAITTANQNNHSVRSKDWRYIRYANGSEELYNVTQDPNEWKNLLKTNRHVHAKVIEEHRRWIPTTNVPPVAGSQGRIVELSDAGVFWEGKKIDESGSIPGIQRETDQALE